MEQLQGADAIEQLIRLHAAEVHRYLSKLTAGDRVLTEDLVQDVFLTLASQRLDDGVARLGLPWLLTVARSRFVDHVRSATARTRREKRDHEASPVSDVSVDALVVSGEQARWMLSQLPDAERWALALAVVDGMPVDELADVLGRSLDATHSLLARGRRRLRSIMEGDLR